MSSLPYLCAPAAAAVHSDFFFFYIFQQKGERETRKPVPVRNLIKQFVVTHTLLLLAVVSWTRNDAQMSDSQLWISFRGMKIAQRNHQQTINNNNVRSLGALTSISSSINCKFAWQRSLESNQLWQQLPLLCTAVCNNNTRRSSRLQ